MDPRKSVPMYISSKPALLIFLTVLSACTMTADSSAFGQNADGHSSRGSSPANGVRSHKARPKDLSKPMDSDRTFMEDSATMGRAEALRRALPKWEKAWREPADLNEEEFTVQCMFGMPPLGPGFIPPPRIAKLLLDRELNYRSTKSRVFVLGQFQHLLKHDISTLFALVRDGLNDNDAEVRSTAAEICISFLENNNIELAESASDGELAFPRVTEVEKDLIVDLLISKVFFDENEDVRRTARSVLELPDVKPNLKRLRSLIRACERAVAVGQIDRSKSNSLINLWSDGRGK